MLKFKEYGIDDSKLPIEDTDDGSQNILASLEPGVKRKCKIWSPSTIHNFCDDQWRFLVPVFSTDAKTDVNRYNLPVSTIIPFVKKHADFDEGAFGKVYKYEIHSNHIKDPLRPVRRNRSICWMGEVVSDFGRAYRVLKSLPSRKSDPGITRIANKLLRTGNLR